MFALCVFATLSEFREVGQNKETSHFLNACDRYFLGTKVTEEGLRARLLTLVYIVLVIFEMYLPKKKT